MLSSMFGTFRDKCSGRWERVVLLFHLISPSTFWKIAQARGEPGIFGFFIYFLSHEQRPRPLGCCASPYPYIWDFGTGEEASNFELQLSWYTNGKGSLTIALRQISSGSKKSVEQLSTEEAYAITILQAWVRISALPTFWHSRWSIVLSGMLLRQWTICQ